MSAYRLYYLSILIILSFVVSYILNLCIFSILLNIGMDVTLSIIGSAIASFFGTISLTNVIEKTSSVITDVTFNFKSFIRNKRDEYEANCYNKRNGVFFVTKGV